MLEEIKKQKNVDPNFGGEREAGSQNKLYQWFY